MESNSATAAPAPGSAHVPKVTATTHESNPFIAAISGLVTILKVNPISAILVTLAGWVLAIGLFVISAVLSWLTKSSGLASLLMLAATLFAIPLLVGSNLVVATESAKGKKIETGDAIQAALAKTLPLVGLGILSVIMITVGLLLLIVPGLIVIARISLAPIVMFEENLGVVDSIKRSFDLTKGHFFEMWGAIIAGSLLSSEGLISPAASVSAVLGRYQQYRTLEQKGTSESAAKAKVHWLNYALFFLLPAAIALITVYTTVVSNNLKDSLNDTNNTYITPTIHVDNNPYTY